MRKITALVLFTVLSPSYCHFGTKAKFIVWNVGQGQWLTAVDSTECLHVDAGGEKAPLEMIIRFCAGKQNFVFFTHGDWDHIRYARWLARKLNACAAAVPLERLSLKKRLQISALRPCGEQLPTLIDEVYKPPPNTRSANSSSRIFVLRLRSKTVLIPGDSTRREEKVWAKQSAIRGADLLVLGHHGSRTSTSEHLLRRLPNVRQTVASARFRKYGHPHNEVRWRVHQSGAALLETQSWGTLMFEL